MRDRKTPPTTPAAPLSAYLKEKGRGSKAEFAEKLDVSQAVLTNWLKRGIPRGRLVEVAQHMGISVEQYINKAEGTEGKTVIAPDIPQGTDDMDLLASLTKKWGSLPRGTKIALVALVQDVGGFVEQHTNETISKFGASKERADNQAVERSYGVPTKKPK